MYCNSEDDEQLCLCMDSFIYCWPGTMLYPTSLIPAAGLVQTFCQVKHEQVSPANEIFFESGKPIMPFLPSFICHTVCFAKVNIPTELTPIRQAWHEADGCSSYVERCYRWLTVKICYLNRVACWRWVACWLLRVYTHDSDSKATGTRLSTPNCLIQEGRFEAWHLLNLVRPAQP